MHKKREPYDSLFLLKNLNDYFVMTSGFVAVILLLLIFN